MSTWFVMMVVCFIIGVALLLYTRRGRTAGVATLEEAGMAVDAAFSAWNTQGRAYHFFVRQVLAYSKQRRIIPARALAELLREVHRIPPQSLERLLSTLVDLNCVPPGEVVCCLRVCKEIYARAGIRRNGSAYASRLGPEPELLRTLEVLKGVAGPLAQNAPTSVRFKDLKALLNALRSQETGPLNRESLRAAWRINLLRSSTRSPFARALRAN